MVGICVAGIQLFMGGLGEAKEYTYVPPRDKSKYILIL